MGARESDNVAVFRIGMSRLMFDPLGKKHVELGVGHAAFLPR